MPEALAGHVGRALVRLRDDLAARGLAVDAPVLVAVSGGPDSVALLHLLRATGCPLVVGHVHHGLQVAADAFERCAARAATGLPFESRRVTVPADAIARQGLEEAAREARHAALAEMARMHGAAAIALAHHRDDQAETVLLQLLRGAGPAGLAGMAERSGDRPPFRWRPLLEVPRQALGAYVAAHALEAIEDPSNLDARHARNALRQDVSPALDRRFPGWQGALARSAALAAEAAALLDARADEDLARLLDERGLSRAGLLDLPRPRQALVLRRWLDRLGERAPPRRRLDEFLRQLAACGGDPEAQPLLVAGAWRLRAWRDHVWADPAADVAAVDLPAWNDGAGVPCLGLGGALQWRRVTALGEGGLPVALLRADARLRTRQPGDRLRRSHGAGSRPLRLLWQDAGVPPWRRAGLPVLAVGTQALWVAGLGMDAAALVTEGERWVPRWTPDPAPDRGTEPG